MKLLLLAGVLVIAVPSAEALQTNRPVPGASAPAADRTAEAYAQFLLAHRLAEGDQVDQAIAAYKRAMALDPQAADIPAELADLYMRQNRAGEAIGAAEQALKIAPDNRSANRVLGTIYASLAAAGLDDRRTPTASQRDVLTRAITHLERALDKPVGQPDSNLRAMLARLYLAANAPDKAVPLLADLVKQEPGWQEGPGLLAEAYAAAGRSSDAIRWLEEAAPDNPQLYPTLGDFYAREQRWNDAAGAYERAMQLSARNFDVRMRYASMLLSNGGKEEAIKARDALRQALGIRGSDERALYLTSEAERRSGDLDAAEASARRLIAQNSKNPRGFYALAQALEERQRYRAIVDALEPAVATFRGTGDADAALGMLLPHLGFAYQQTGAYEKAISTFEDARKLAPGDLVMLGYLVQANLAAKRFEAAAELVRTARADRPDDLRLARLEAQALRQGGKVDESIAVLEDMLRRHADDPAAHVALAQHYSDSNRGQQAVKLLQDAQTKFPADDSVVFELGAVYDKLKRPADAEAAMRRVIARDPEHAPALNYLGYMLAERGERLTESVELLKRALTIEPDNGSYLDSIGWAYFKSGDLKLAEENLRRAAEQLTTNSVVQDHYGDVLVKLGRLEEAISAWTRALAGDGDSIDRAAIDRKVRSAREKLPRR